MLLVPDYFSSPPHTVLLPFHVLNTCSSYTPNSLQSLSLSLIPSLHLSFTVSYCLSLSLLTCFSLLPFSLLLPPPPSSPSASPSLSPPLSLPPPPSLFSIHQFLPPHPSHLANCFSFAPHLIHHFLLPEPLDNPGPYWGSARRPPHFPFRKAHRL